MTLRLNDWFCGAGGATQGAHCVPGVEPILAANHDQLAIETHSANFPKVEHFRGDIKDLDVAGHPYAELFWASPECTNWSKAKGKPVDYDKEPALFGDPDVAEDVQRSRALMQDVIRYLEGMELRQRPVLAGVVENVIDIRKWVLWGDWLGRIQKLGYRTRLIALNSMHANAQLTPRAPQSRDRLYLAYWHRSLGRDPDWDKWLRPTAHCQSCDATVAAVQVWKRPGNNMGRYRQQYVYRCPQVSCRGQQVEPDFVPAYTVIDWTLPAERIGDRRRPLAAKTEARIAHGIRTNARPIAAIAGGHRVDVAVPPMLVPAGGTWNDTATPADSVMRTRTTRATEAVVVPPMLVPVEGREGKRAQPIGQPLRTQTARSETAVVVPPFITELRGGGSKSRPIADPLSTVTASGNHHGLSIPETWARWAKIYSYDTGRLALLGRPLPAQTTVVGDALVGWDLPAVEDCRFRMLEPHEIHAGMAFVPSYVVLGSKRERIKQLGNAVTPPVAEVLVSALVECIQGHPIEWRLAA